MTGVSCSCLITGDRVSFGCLGSSCVSASPNSDLTSNLFRCDSVRSRLDAFQEFGHRAGEPARSRPLKDWFESIQGAVQVEEANAVKRVDVYLRDQQFEFAASQYIFHVTCTLLCFLLCLLFLINCYTSQEDLNVFVDSIQPDLIGLGS